MATDSVPFYDLEAAHREMRDELDLAWARVMDSGSFIRGAEVEAFEHEFSLFCGATGCVGTGNGLDSIVLILRALGVGAGDEVVVPGLTFIATFLAVSQVGATPVPVDVDPATMNIATDQVEAAITSRTAAVMPVHLYGRLSDTTELARVTDRHGLALIEDAAQAHGARSPDGRMAGALGVAAAFSFYPGKNLGALGDAGAVVSTDADLISRVRRLGNYGSDVKYVHAERGANSRLDEFQAAVLRVKLARLEAWNAARRRVADSYTTQLRDADVVLPAPAGLDHVWHQYVIRHADRDVLADALHRRGVGSQVHYPFPPHRSEAYVAELGHAPLPVTDQCCDEVLSLPIGPHVSTCDQQLVVDAVLACTDSSA